MKLRDWLFLLGGASAGLLVYGALYESKRLVVEHCTISLPDWPERLRGYRIAVLGDFHVRDEYSMDLAQRAVSETLDAEPDMTVLTGDFVGYWKPESARMLGDLLEPFLLLNGDVVAVPGNHDYWLGDPSLLAPILGELNIKFLRNESWSHHGITWIGIDSFTEGEANPYAAATSGRPSIVLWHEPDPVDELPFLADLQISGHSHGGQWHFPGWTPTHTKNGQKYVQGFHRAASGTPIYVNRGIGTTGPPARFLCPPEVTILTLVPGDAAALVEYTSTPT